MTEETPRRTETNTPRDPAPPARPYSKAEYNKAVAQFTGVDHDGPISHDPGFVARDKIKRTYNIP